MSRVGLVALGQVLVGEAAEAFRFFTLRPVAGAVAGHEVVQVHPGQGVGFQREVLVGAQVVDPQVPCALPQ